MRHQLRTRIDRLLAWQPPRRSFPVALAQLSLDDLEVLEQLALRAKMLPAGQILIATLDEDDRARLECIAAKAGLDAPDG